MENKELSFMDLLLEAHIDLVRQGPGSPETVEKALGFLEPLDRFSQIADLGCGTGGQTLLLAKRLKGNVTGLDLFPDFIEKLNAKAKAENLENRVKGVAGDMADLPFEKESFDLIWSEGAIDNIGFEKGLKHWHGFLKNGGYVAVNCPSWVTKEHPNEAEKFWSDAGSHLDPVEKNIAVMQNAGYEFTAAFVLPKECWTENYFKPREQAINRMLKKYPESDTMKEYAEINKKEVDLFLKYGSHYGYVFYIGRAVK